MLHDLILSKATHINNCAGEQLAVLLFEAYSCVLNATTDGIEAGGRVEFNPPAKTTCNGVPRGCVASRSETMLGASTTHRSMAAALWVLGTEVVAAVHRGFGNRRKLVYSNQTAASHATHIVAGIQIHLTHL